MGQPDRGTTAVRAGAKGKVPDQRALQQGEGERMSVVTGGESPPKVAFSSRILFLKNAWPTRFIKGTPPAARIRSGTARDARTS